MKRSGFFCKDCNEFKKEEDRLEKYLSWYCKTCYEKKEKLIRLSKLSVHSPNVSVEAVGLDWQLDSIRGRALEIMKKNSITLNSDEALFLFYLEEFESRIIIRKPTKEEIYKVINNIYETPSQGENVLRAFFRMLRIDHTQLTSFQTIRLARQELKREAKRKGMIQLFDPVVEEMRKEREETIKERYIREL